MVVAQAAGRRPSGAFMAAKKRSAWQYRAGRNVKSRGKEGEIDLLAWTPEHAEELLLVEYKATLEVAEIHEIGEATAAMQGGQDQLQRCIEILGMLKVEEKRVIYPFVLVGENQGDVRHHRLLGRESV